MPVDGDDGAGPSAPSIVTLVTDFGARDGFVGTMKGVLLARCPGAQLVDLTHDLDPGDVAGGALILRAAAPFFPPGTVHLAVVDPGVGGPRRALAMTAGGQTFVGPDNGLLWPAAAGLGEPEAVELREAGYRLPVVSATFHGRDVFAPAAAYLAAGVAAAAMGPPCPDPQRLDLPKADEQDGKVSGEVLWVDRFGNAITNLEPAAVRRRVGERFRVRAGSARLDGPDSHYGAVDVGQAVVVVGSLGYYEIAIRGGSASAILGLSRGMPVVIERAEE